MRVWPGVSESAGEGLRGVSECPEAEAAELVEHAPTGAEGGTVSEPKDLVQLVNDLKAHAREHGWQDFDEPIVALIAREPAPPVPAGEEDVKVCESCQQPITGRVVRWLDDVVTCESCSDGPDVRAGDIIDLVEPPLSGYVVGTNWDSPRQWKNPKAARRITRVYRLVWSKDGTK